MGTDFRNAECGPAFADYGVARPVPQSGTGAEWAAVMPSTLAPDCLVAPRRGKRRVDHDELLREITRVRGKVARLKQEIFNGGDMR